MTAIAVVTIVAGRRQHLAGQLEGLRRQRRPADQLVIVRMDQQDVAVVGDEARSVSVIDLSAKQPDRLRLAAARNRGVRTSDADTVILLDVDCIPGAGLVEAYEQAQTVDGLLCGSVRYLPPGHPTAGWRESDLWAASRPHPARPSPGPGRLVREDRHELAWTTSLALRRDLFERVGGFDERFTGYGGEDTDFGVRAAAAGLGVWWSDDAVAYHQHHGTANPPVQHLEDIVRNAILFDRLHGWYPMTGWLEAFRDQELIDFDPQAGLLALRTDRVAHG